MIIPSWWLWMIIAIQGERGVFWEMETRACRRVVTASLKTPHLWHTYKNSPSLSTYSCHRLTTLKSVSDGSKRPAVAKCGCVAQCKQLTNVSGGKGGRRGLAASLLVNWKPCRRARNLPEIPIDRGILQQGRRRSGGGRRPDAPIDDCHLLHCRRPEPMVAKNRESKITAICTQESNGGRTWGGGLLRDGHQGERERKGPSWKNQC